MAKQQHVILYIDDDQDYLDAMRAIVESEGYTMVEARSGEQGLKAYRDQPPDLVIVDLMMEEVDAGTSFVRELQAIGNTAPVYMLSSLGDTLTLTVDTGALGLTGVLQKPVDPGSLLTMLRARFGTAAS